MNRKDKMTQSELFDLARKAGKICNGKDWNSYNKQSGKLLDALKESQAEAFTHNMAMEIFEKYASQ